jgi:uncharacterized protein YecE (DUF72 family)
MRVHAGTSGYSYKEWKGAFYPEDLPAKAMLAYYAERLPAVEINNTFYRMPRAEVVAGWRDEVPEGFRFVLKANRRVTHLRRLRSAEEDLAFMLGQFGEMGERLGAILFQLPPNMKQDLERLEAFLPLLPEGTRAAFEFRHTSWFAEETYALLRTRGAALVASDVDGEEDAPLVATAPWTYLRLWRETYADEDLERWAARVRAGDWDDVFAFFKHEDEGSGPPAAQRFLELASG